MGLLLIRHFYIMDIVRKKYLPGIFMTTDNFIGYLLIYFLLFKNTL